MGSKLFAKAGTMSILFVALMGWIAGGVAESDRQPIGISRRLVLTVINPGYR